MYIVHSSILKDRHRVEEIRKESSCNRIHRRIELPRAKIDHTPLQRLNRKCASAFFKNTWRPSFLKEYRQTDTCTETWEKVWAYRPAQPRNPSEGGASRSSASLLMLLSERLVASCRSTQSVILSGLFWNGHLPQTHPHLMRWKLRKQLCPLLSRLASVFQFGCYSLQPACTVIRLSATRQIESGSL